MQRIHGNAAVCRMLAASRDTVQRDEADPIGNPAGGASGRKTFTCAAFAGDAKLEDCLNDRDRLKVGDAGESVRKVQQGLLDDGIALPQFGADSKYGSETATAVKQFKRKHNLGATNFGDAGPGTMGELDRLCGGIKPQPKPSPNPAPVPTPANDSQLEDTLDDIWLQHQLVLRNQDAALLRLETDLLTNPDKQTDLGVESLKFIVKTALGALVGGAGSFLSDQIQTGLKQANMSDDDQKLVVDSGVNPIFDAAKSAVQDGATDKVQSAMVKDDKSVDVYIDAQRALLTDVSGDAQEVFLTQTKAALRQPAALKPGDPVSTEDPRVTRAKRYVQAVKRQRTSAFEKQYTESAQKYAVGEAQTALKTKPDDNQGGREGTDLSKETLDKADIGKLKGVLRVGLKLDKPDKPAKIESVEVGGLSDKTRKRLLSQHATLLGLGLPIIAEGASGGFIGIGRTKIRIGRNENLTVFESGSNDKGIAYLKAKALNLKNELPPDANITADEQHGAEQIFQEIDQQKIAELKGP
jgi:peptidoglycan hydrolase-like protein with peptidoglycan-binding domain